MEFWRRHKRKVYVTFGVLGSGYLLYKLYEGHRRRLSDLERELVDEKRYEELIRSQIKKHFDKIQTIANSTTLPHVMRHLSSRIDEELDLTHLMERLVKGKEEPNSLSTAEKLELWDKLKILNFTRIVFSLWATTIPSLYIRAQVNILGRHIYIDTVHDLGSSIQLDIEANSWKVNVYTDNNTFQETRWRSLRVGDLMKVFKDEYFPADLLLLSSSYEDGICYVETSNLDGETNLKLKRALNITSSLNDDSSFQNCKVVAKCEAK